MIRNWWVGEMIIQLPPGDISCHPLIKIGQCRVLRARIVGEEL